MGKWESIWLAGRDGSTPILGTGRDGRKIGLEDSREIGWECGRENGQAYVCIVGKSVRATRAPLRGRLTPPATLAQARLQLNVKRAERRGP